MTSGLTGDHLHISASGVCRWSRAREQSHSRVQRTRVVCAYVLGERGSMQLWSSSIRRNTTVTSKGKYVVFTMVLVHSSNSDSDREVLFGGITWGSGCDLRLFNWVLLLLVWRKVLTRVWSLVRRNSFQCTIAIGLAWLFAYPSGGGGSSGGGRKF